MKRQDMENIILNTEERLEDYFAQESLPPKMVASALCNLDRYEMEVSRRDWMVVSPWLEFLAQRADYRAAACEYGRAWGQFGAALNSIEPDAERLAETRCDGAALVLRQRFAEAFVEYEIDEPVNLYFERILDVKVADAMDLYQDKRPLPDDFMISTPCGQDCKKLIDTANSLLGQMADTGGDVAGWLIDGVYHQCRVFYFG